MYTREEFRNWLANGNARKYSPKVILSCMDRISEYALRKDMMTESLWEYTNLDTFNQLYNRLINKKLLRITSGKTHKVFIIAGKLYMRFLKEKLSNLKDAVNTIAEDNTVFKSTNTSTFSSRELIDPEDVIAWLITQPNANGTLYLENVVRQYMRVLKSAPIKLEIPIGLDDRNVFRCQTARELNVLWDIFKSASNYKQVNRSTSSMFSAGMGCFLRYLQNQSKSAANKENNSEIITKLTDVLSSHFSNGYRLNSPIELVRFKSFASEILGDEISMMSDDMLKRYISACGMAYDGKIYIVSTKTKEHIKELAHKYFVDGAQVIFFEEFYSKNENWLFNASVVSVDMLTNILRELFPKLFFTQIYFGYVRDSVIDVLESEILRIWGGDTLLTYEQIAERLMFVPFERIKHALSQNNNFIWSGVGTFSHISRIKIADEDRNVIRKVAEYECDTHGYISITDLPLREIEERNYELSITAIHNAVYRICLLDKFDKKGKIITRKGDTLDALTIMKEYCKTIDKCSLKDLLNFEKELTGEIHRWIPMEAGNAVMVRIDKDTYVADKYVNFNSDLIDEAIERFFEGDYLPLKAFTTFAAFPDCMQVWNLFLLESYCRRFSKKFRFDALSVNSRNAGVVIRKSCNMDYMEIMIDAVAKADIPLNDNAVGQFLFKDGYTGRSKTSRVDEIIKKAKDIRERRN